MAPLPPSAPELTVRVSAAEADDSPSQLDSVSADISLLGGARLRARRGEAAVNFSIPLVPTDGELLHPYLAPAAALVWQWEGREALHAGAVELGRGAVLLFGAKTAGKSTTLAWLAREAGIAVLADDLVVIDSGAVLAGPRSIDLRTEDAGGDASAGSGAVVRGGERLRVTLPPAPASLPATASVLLRWGERVELSPIAPAERLAVLGSLRSYPPLPPDDAALLELASREMVVLERPRTPAGLREAGEALLSRFG